MQRTRAVCVRFSCQNKSMTNRGHYIKIFGRSEKWDRIFFSGNFFSRARRWFSARARLLCGGPRVDAVNNIITLSGWTRVVCVCCRYTGRFSPVERTQRLLCYDLETLLCNTLQRISSLNYRTFRTFLNRVTRSEPLYALFVATFVVPAQRKEM